MSSDVQGRALAVLNRVAQADWPDRLKLRKPFEKLIYTGSRASFRAAAQRAGKVAKLPRPADPDALFDLSLSDEQQMLVEMLEAFASEVLRPLAHDADEQAFAQADPDWLRLQGQARQWLGGPLGELLLEQQRPLLEV